MRSYFLFFLILACAGALAHAQSAADKPPVPDARLAFDAAVRAFDDNYFDRADKEFGEFIINHPESDLVAQAVLLQARARYQLKNFAGAAELLRSRLDGAGALADQFQFWIAESLLQQHQNKEAAQAYANLLHAYPESQLRLQAAFGEAYARFRDGDINRVIELLNDPEKPFQKSAASSTNDVVVVQGFLLLGEAFFAQKNYDAVAAALERLSNRRLSPETEWQRQFLLASSELAAQKPDAALQRSTNLVSLSIAVTNKPVLQATSLNFQAEILKNQDPEAAIRAYEQITGIKGIPTNQVRQALFKIVDLRVVQNRLPEAVQRLDTYAAAHPTDPALDLITLTSGELLLKQYFPAAKSTNATEAAAAFTNHLAKARAKFDWIVQHQTNSAHLGKAFLNRGWTFWEEGGRNSSAYANARADFQNAVRSLPPGNDQAAARLKLGDVELKLGNHAAAVAAYSDLLAQASESPAPKPELLAQAGAKLVHAHLEAGNFSGAGQALEQLLKAFPEDSLSETTLLHFGQALLDAGEPVQARDQLARFVTQFPKSALLPEARLAIARTYVRQEDWTAALGEFDRWIASYTNHVALPRAEFDRAWTHAHAGHATNALALFTQFVATHPSNELSPLAQIWIGDYHFNGGDFYNAELNYQHAVLARNPNLQAQGRLMAGKSALLREKPSNARPYLNSLINEGPDWIKPEAYFLLGEVEMEDRPAGATNSLEHFEKALVVFETLAKLYPDHRLEPLARGQMANCLFQLASADPRRYDDAIREYKKVLASPKADVTARSQAEVGLGLVSEKLASIKEKERKEEHLKAALNHYLNVAHGKILRPGSNERPDPFWTKEAGLHAAQLAERMNLTAQAAKTYERLVKEFPALRNIVEARMSELSNE